MTWTPTRAGAEKRLAEFLEFAGAYGRERNHVHEGNSHVSTLSPWIRCRLLSEYEVAGRALEAYRFAEVEKFIQEVYWRIYWKGWLEMRPGVWSDYRDSLPGLRDSLSPEARQALHALEAGEDRCPLMARFSRELIETGYLHNHVRMWFAGYWIHCLGLPWQLGADFFYRHLLDADPASNTLSWRWVAGLQTPGKTYQARASNIRKFCHYPEADDPDLDRHLEVKGDILPGVGKPAPEPEWEPAGKPCLEQSYVLWIHGEDLSFWREPGILPEGEPESAVGVVDPDLARRFSISQGREQFMRGALQDSLDSFGRETGKEAHLRTGDLAGELIEQARAVRCGTIAGMLPPVGALRDVIPRLRQRLEEGGIRLVLWRRPQDEERMPLAKRGFFRFWKDLEKRETF